MNDLQGKREKMPMDPFAEWDIFYSDCLNLKIDWTDVSFTASRKPQAGFGRNILVANELIKASKNKPYAFLIEAMGEKIDNADICDRNIDYQIAVNDRWPDRSYFISCRDRAEADQELRGLSADNLAARGIVGMTCLERLIFGFKYYSETGRHLDKNCQTLCIGSRYKDGKVPMVYYFWGDILIYEMDSLKPEKHCGAREVII